MSGSNSSTNSDDWARFWAQAQEQAWETWQSVMTRPTVAAESDPDQVFRIWSEGLEQLWQGYALELSDTQREVFTRLLDQGKGFLFLSHQMLKAFERMQHQTDGGKEWKPILRRCIDQAQGQLRHWAGISTGQAALWGLPMEMWERIASTLAITPGDWSQALKAAGRVSGEESGGATGLLDWPALGVSREWQLQLREGVRRSESWHEAWRSYAARLVDVGVLALDYLYERLVEAGERGKPLSELRELYDLWVDCAERAYAEVVVTREFAQTQAGLINASIELKRYLQEMLERIAEANNQPTRRELDAAHRAIKEMRGELDALRAEQEKRAGPSRVKKSDKRK